MADQIKVRRDTATNWTSNNPVLADGEMGLERGTNQFKFGDGATTWSALPYVGGGSSTSGGGTYTKPTAGIPDSDLTAPTTSILAGLKARFDATTVGADGDVYTYDSDTGKYGPLALPTPASSRGVSLFVVNTGAPNPSDALTGDVILERAAPTLGLVAMGKGSGTATATATTPATTASIDVGDYVLVACGSSYETAAVTHAITFSTGAAALTQIVSKVQGASGQLDFMFGKCTTAIPIGATITDTASASRLDLAFKVLKITGLLGTGAFDAQASNGVGSTVVPSIGPTGTTSQANEIVVAAYVWNPNNSGTPLTFAPPTGYTLAGTAASSSTGTTDTGPRQLDVAYKILTATGAQTAAAAFTRATGDTTSVSFFAGVMATFKAA